MSLFNIFRKTGKQYAVPESTARKQPDEEQRATVLSRAMTTVEMGQKGEVVVRCDPADILGKTDSTLSRHKHNNSNLPSALSLMNASIPAGPDLRKSKTLTRTGNMTDNQAAFSPLQGTVRLQSMRIRPCSRRTIEKQQSLQPSLTGTLAHKTALGEMGTMMQPTQGPKCLLTELENLSMDMHSQWLDAFTACPIPSLVLSTTDEPQILLVNSACVTALGPDSSTLGTHSLADLIGSEQSICCAKAAESGFEFIAPDCSVQVGRAMKCSSLFIPISDVCTSGRPQCYLMLLLDSFTQPLCSGAVENVPSPGAVQGGASDPPVGWKKGLFSMGDQGGSSENYNQAVGIVSGYAEAAQRRLKGASLGMTMPPQFDVGAWIAHFEKLLTLGTAQ